MCELYFSHNSVGDEGEQAVNMIANARSLMPVRPQFDFQLRVALHPLREYDDLRLVFCEALF
jgi:hypothetical protein